MAIITFREKLDKLKTAIGALNGKLGVLLGLIRDRLNNHTQAQGNVHNLTPDDISLGLVPNWGPATLDEAKMAQSNSAFMTPRRVDNYNQANLYQALVDVFDEAASKL